VISARMTSESHGREHRKNFDVECNSLSRWKWTGKAALGVLLNYSTSHSSSPLDSTQGPRASSTLLRRSFLLLLLLLLASEVNNLLLSVAIRRLKYGVPRQ